MMIFRGLREMNTDAFGAERKSAVGGEAKIM
jgi:hypothetical protein